MSDTTRGTGSNPVSRSLKILFFVGSILAASPALANCEPLSMKQEFARSAFVGLIRVKAVTWLDENRRPTRLRPPLMLGTMPGGFDPYSGALYTVDRITTYKGRQPSRFDIFSENTEARTPLRVGQSYLVFLYRATTADEWDRVGDLMIDYCGYSAPASKVADRIAKVKRLARSR